MKMNPRIVLCGDYSKLHKNKGRHLRIVTMRSIEKI